VIALPAVVRRALVRLRLLRDPWRGWGRPAPWGDGPTTCIHCLGKKEREVFYDDETAANLAQLHGGGGAR